MNLEVKISQDPCAAGLPLPSYATDGSAGCDLSAAIEKQIVITPGERRLVSTGIRIALPLGYEAQIRPRSGLALKYGVTMVNSPGTIDSDYRGVICVILINHGQDNYTIHRGDRVAQMIIAPVTQAQWSLQQTLEETDRGDGGFGSTGQS